MSLSVYVCSGSSEAETAAHYVAKLREAGVTITVDWSAEVLKARAAGKADAAGRSDHVLTDDERRAAKAADLRGVEDADYLWFVVPGKASFGSGYEFCHAEHVETKTIVSGDAKQSLFLVEADHTFETHEEALDWLVAESRTRERHNEKCL